VDLLASHHHGGRRFEPTELIERGDRVAVAFAVTDLNGGERWRTYTVFAFEPSGERVVSMHDCIDRADALAKLACSD
jgi:hypothetical protein